MVRSRRAPVWWRLPGVVAAYQFVVAPSYVHMLDNVAPSGGYPLTSAAYPGWAQQTGATFTAASSQYLATGITPAAGWTVLARYSGAAANTYLLGGGQFQRYAIIPLTAGGSSGFNYFNGTDTYIASGTAAGTIGMAGAIPYRNGVAIGSALTYVGTSIRAIYIGALNTGSVTGPFTGVVQSVLFAERQLSDAEMSLASHQMAYCEYNPAWNAWAPERRYFVMAPAAAGGAAKMNTYFRRMRS